MSEKKPMWAPSPERIQRANMTQFIKQVNEKYARHFSTHDELYEWSIDNIPDFWAAMWDYAEIRASQPYDRVIDDLGKMPGAIWFTGAKLNFAENLLRYRDDHLALIFKGEAQETTRMTYRQLYGKVAQLAKSLRDAGVVPGDRVAGFVPNMPETIIAMLAATSLGAVWSSCSPDFGIRGVLDRFGQIKPKIIFTANGYSYKGNKIDCLERLADILRELPSTEKVIVVPYTEAKPDLSMIPQSIHYHDFISQEDNLELEFPQLDFNHPLYIMYSSGTTGLPKCLVQSAGGILLYHIVKLKRYNP